MISGTNEKYGYITIIVKSLKTEHLPAATFSSWYFVVD